MCGRTVFVRVANGHGGGAIVALILLIVYNIIYFVGMHVQL